MIIRSKEKKMISTEQQIILARELIDDLKKVMTVGELTDLADKILTLKGIGDDLKPNYISECVANLIYEKYGDGTL
jgi:ethanolamine utilization protein EutA (predicted chaperonin)